ncbi:hypothetical protein [Nocardia wallacei]|uniref:hypothetical protein n=1 Tax=Nocardia wallacei TaxID=480035 RepID=UPI00245802E7|nr:hypothetical protein [Nocardia wallacei]
MDDDNTELTIDDEVAQMEADESQPEWQEWLDGIRSRMSTFLTATVPGMPQPWWSNDALHHIEDVFARFFPDEDSLSNPDKFGIADQFVTYIGECFVRRAGGIWMNLPGEGQPLYESFGPGVFFGYSKDDINCVESLASAAESRDFGEVTGDMISHLVDYAHYLDVPSESICE